MARYIPALRFGVLTGYYDRIVAATTRERTLKSKLVAQVGLQPGERLLDVGCGTATLTILLKESCMSAEVVGLDGDSKTLAIGKRKAAVAPVEIAFRLGMSWDLGVPDASFDHVTTSLLLHHLDREDKRRTLEAARRALKPGGQLHVADWGRAHDPLMRFAFLGVQLLDGFKTTTDNVRGKLPEYMARAGFVGVEETQRLRTPLGSISIYRARR